MIDVVFLGINDIGERVYDWLTDQNDVRVRALLTEPDQLELIRQVEPELVISAGFRSIVPEEVLAVPDRGAVNLHKSYLPYNRGANPNVWSIIEDAPAGVSIHYMVADVDRGPIIDRRKVPVYPDDDGRSLYERLEAEQFKQFRDVWPEIKNGSAETIQQDPDAGSYHYKSDFVDLWKIDLDATVRAGELIDRLRALTFEPYDNAYFEIDDNRYYMELSIRPSDETAAEEPSAGVKNVPRYTEENQG